MFTRYPEAGKAKTRLIPKVGAESAARLQHAMTGNILSVAAQLAAVRRVCVEVRVEGADAARMHHAFGNDFSTQPQGDGDLGERMQR